MKNIYILDEFRGENQTGVGSFIQELLYCLNTENVCLIQFNSLEPHFSIISNNGIKEMHFPPFFVNGFILNYKIIDKFFRLYISDSPDNVFILNHGPCEKMMEIIKKSYPLSKQVFVIHDFIWSNLLLGNYHLYEKILKQKKQKKIQTRYKTLLECFAREQQMYGIADKIVCLSEDTYRLLFESYEVEQNKLCLIPNGLRNMYRAVSSVEKCKLIRKAFIGENEDIILFVGRTIPEKGIHILIEAFKEVLKTNKNCRLVVVGTISDSDWLFKCINSVAAKVTFTGNLNKKELQSWYSIADVGIITSFSEQCSYAGIEMMMHKLPIVAVDSFGVRCMFEDNVNARVANISDRKTNEKIKNIADSLIDILDSPILQKQLKKKAREIYLKKYNPERMKTGYIQLLKSL